MRSNGQYAMVNMQRPIRVTVAASIVSAFPIGFIRDRKGQRCINLVDFSRL